MTSEKEAYMDDVGHTYAPLTSRLCGFLVDAVVGGVVPGTIVYFYAIRPAGLAIDWEITCWLGLVILSVLMPILTEGATFGDLLFGIRVISLDSRRTARGRIVFRNLSYCLLIVNAFLSILGVAVLVVATLLVFVPPFSEKRATAWDVLMKTVVVKLGTVKSAQKEASSISLENS